ncbi:MAG: hypothetical protein ACXAES_16805 [Promethearchaeota archaeon]|jgi:hypothetical protein
MTHTLHRKGTVEDLKEDYVMLAMFAAGINDSYDDSHQKMVKIGEIMKKYNPVNIISEIVWATTSTVTAAFDNLESVKNIIRELKKEDFGISIVVSGLISEIEETLKELELDPHTIHFSLGTFSGPKTQSLPSEKILEITTMCGHHTVSPQSITNYVKLIKQGKMTIEKAAAKLTKPCVCGIVNTKRIIKVLNNLIGEKKT